MTSHHAFAAALTLGTSLLPYNGLKSIELPPEWTQYPPHAMSVGYAATQLSGDELMKARKRFAEGQESRYGVHRTPPTEVAMNSLGLTRAQLLQKLQVECPKYPSEPLVAQSHRWSYTWEMLDRVSADFRFTQDARVESVHLTSANVAYPRKVGHTFVMSDHLSGFIPRFAYKHLPAKKLKGAPSVTVPQVQLDMTLVQGYIDDEMIANRAASFGPQFDTAAFWLIFKNPKNGTVVTLCGMALVTDLSDKKRVLDTASGTYKTTYTYRFPEHWEVLPVYDVFVGKKPRITSKHVVKVALPQLPVESSLSLP